ncbi:hypothetical protein [Pseudomonas cavernicola]|uniref:hypothetical protein n=1 Tax=Pseudomonas cavernicola TaxID=2320866 RepID=UPI0015B17506|nr:hypothetical protein [Pseudomonas cavernicola]
MSEFNYDTKKRPFPSFGDYALIEMKRHGVPSEIYTHKVINTYRSNTWVDVPVQSPPTAVIHAGEMEEVASVICCGISEDKVYPVRVSDLKPRVQQAPDADIQQLMTFYDAKDVRDLIDQQADHVKVLQLRLSPYLNEPNPIARIREG